MMLWGTEQDGPARLFPHLPYGSRSSSRCLISSSAGPCSSPGVQSEPSTSPNRSCRKAGSSSTCLASMMWERRQLQARKGDKSSAEAALNQPLVPHHLPRAKQRWEAEDSIPSSCPMSKGTQPPQEGTGAACDTQGWPKRAA